MPRGVAIGDVISEVVARAQVPPLAFVYPDISRRTLSLEDVMPDETANLFDIMATTRSMRRLKPDPFLRS
jgi:hypothetical protein